MSNRLGATSRGRTSWDLILRWINQTKHRYYQVHLTQDLFGEWTLIRVWGGLGSHRGGMKSTGVASYADGVAQIRAIAKRRQQRGYRNTDDGACGATDPVLASQ